MLLEQGSSCGFVWRVSDGTVRTLADGTFNQYTALRADNLLRRRCELPVLLAGNRPAFPERSYSRPQCALTVWQYCCETIYLKSGHKTETGRHEAIHYTATTDRHLLSVKIRLTPITTHQTAEKCSKPQEKIYPSTGLSIST